MLWLMLTILKFHISLFKKSLWNSQIWNSVGGGRGRGCSEGGEGIGVTGVIVVRVCEPVFQNLPHSYTWPLKKRTHSYTRSSEMLTYSCTVLWFFVPIYCWLLDKYQSIHWISREQAASKKSLSEKYVNIPGCQKNGAFHIWILKNRFIHILFVEKRGQLYNWEPPHPPPPHTHTHTHTHTLEIVKVILNQLQCWVDKNDKMFKFYTG